MYDMYMNYIIYVNICSLILRISKSSCAVLLIYLSGLLFGVCTVFVDEVKSVYILLVREEHVSSLSTSHRNIYR